MVPLQKQSKKNQKAFFAQKRGNWNGISPVSRVVPSGKTYNRNRLKQIERKEACS